MNTTNQPKLSSEFHAAAQSLAETLVASQPFVDYEQAIQRLEADPNASGLLNHMWETQSELRQRQQKGSLTQADIAGLRQIEQQVQSDPVIMAFAEAQTNAVKLLREVNNEISDRIGMDFSSLARRSCG